MHGFCLIQCLDDPLMWVSEKTMVGAHLLEVFDMAWSTLSPMMTLVGSHSITTRFARICRTNDPDNGSWDAVYWRIIDYLWQSCCKGELDPENLPFQHSLETIMPLSYIPDVCAMLEKTACPWLRTPQDMPCCFEDDDTGWEHLSRIGRVVVWTDPNEPGTRAWISPEMTGVSVYDIEWLFVKWTKDLAYYNPDIGTVMPRYPTDELNRLVHPDKVAMVVHRYIQYRYGSGRCRCSAHALLQPLWILVGTPEGRPILECVYELYKLMEARAGHDVLLRHLYQWRQRTMCRLMWEDNYGVQVLPEKKKILFHPQALLSMYLSRSMMWMHHESDWQNHNFWKYVWEGFWTTRVYDGHGQSPTATVAAMNNREFLGELVLSASEKMDPEIVSMLRIMRKDPSRLNNWSRLRTITAQKHRLASMVRNRWSKVLEAWRSVCHSPLCVTTNHTHASLRPFLENFQWIDREHIRHHSQEHADPIVRETSRRFDTIYPHLSKRNMSLWESANLPYPDEQERPFEHLSRLDPAREYPDLHTVVRSSSSS